MKKKWNYYSGCAVLLLTLVSGTEQVAAEDVSDITVEQQLFSQGLEITRIYEELNGMRATIIALNNDISTQTVEKDKLEERIVAKEKEVEKVQTELDKKIQAYEDNLAIAQKRAISLQTQEKPRSLMLVESLLEADTLADLIGRAYNMSLLLNSHTDFMAQLEEERIAIETVKESVLAEKRAIEKDKDKVSALLEGLEKRKKEADNKTKALEEKRKTIEKEYSESMEAYQAKRRDAVQALERILIDKEAEQADIHAIAETALSALQSPAGTLSMPTLPSRSFELPAVAGPSSDSKSHAAYTQTISRILASAASHIGVPYVWGGATPAGFDCSGLTQYVFNQSGISLPRVTTQQEQVGEKVGFTDLLPGDLLFWGEVGNTYHVGIYIGGGKYIHAPQPGHNVQVLSLSDFMPSFARRVVPLVPEPVATKMASADALAAVTPTKHLGTFEITHYNSDNGRTRMGTSMANQNILTKDGYRIVAVDPNVIPMGTILKITTNYGETFLGQADDTGGVIHGNIIDIAVKSHSEAIQKGRGSATVEIVK